MPAALLLMIASTGVAALLPATSGFVSLLLVLVRGVGWDRGGGWTVVLLVAVGFVLLTAASTRVVRRTFFGPPEPGSVSPSELRWWESLAVVLVILLAVVGGIVPGTFL
jgi:NADH:ubiquinone oxidoreductase subunit 4 (subunit M)